MKSCKVIVLTCFLMFIAAFAGAADIEWNTAGPANYFTTGNWNPNQVPGAGDDGLIHNNGTATADGTESGNPTTTTLDSLAVGDLTGDGVFNANNVSFTLSNGDFSAGAVHFDDTPTSGTTTGVSGVATITDASALTLTFGDINVGEMRAKGTAITQGTGELTIERVDTVSLSGDLDVGTNVVDDANGATATGSGTLTIRDVDTLSVDGDIDIADGEVNDDAVSGRGTAVYDATVLIERVNTLTFGSDLDLGQVAANAEQTETVTLDATFRDIGQLNGGSIDFLQNGAHGEGDEAGVLTYDGTLTFENSTITLSGDIDLHNTVNMSGDGVVNAVGAMNLVDSTMTVNTGDTVEIGAIDYKDGDSSGSLGGGADGNTVEAYVNLTRSRLNAVDEIKLGRRLNNVPGNLTASIDLDEGSMVSTAMLEVGDEGSIVAHLEGTTRVTSATVGGSDLYSAVDADDALLGGTFIAEFDFIPVSGRHTFDLLQSASATSLDDATATYTVRDLNAGFEVEFFGVAQDDSGNDVVRLTVVGIPTAPSLGRWGAMLFAALLLATGVWMRRKGARG